MLSTQDDPWTQDVTLLAQLPPIEIVQNPLLHVNPGQSVSIIQGESTVLSFLWFDCKTAKIIREMIKNKPQKFYP